MKDSWEFMTDISSPTWSIGNGISDQSSNLSWGEKK